LQLLSLLQLLWSDRVFLDQQITEPLRHTFVLLGEIFSSKQLNPEAKTLSSANVGRVTQIVNPAKRGVTNL
jgi:hypothetical protein